MKKNLKKYKYNILFLLLSPVAFIINYAAHQNPYITEKIYSSYIYPAMSYFFSYQYSLLPFSVAEVVITVMVIFIALVFIRLLLSVKTGLSCFKKTFITTILLLVYGFNIIYTVFIFTCGINYARPPYLELLGYEKKQYSKEQLEEMCVMLIDECNEKRLKILGNEYSTKKELLRYYQSSAKNVFDEYSNPKDVISGYSLKPKLIKTSRIMSYLNITGFYFPFTYESNINADVVPYSIPSTMLHEIAHYKGFMRESDANFLAYLAGSQSSNPDFAYSANMMALSYSLNAYYKYATAAEYSDLYNKLSPGVKKDLEDDRIYWKQFETPVAAVSETINDSYLKSNNQTSGVHSYGEMVDSLLAYYNQ